MVREQVIDPFFPQCPVRNVLSRIGGKWPLLVLLTLDEAKAPLRFTEIERKIGDISQKMLALTLHELEADGLIKRQAFAEVPPRVEYSLTERTQTLMPLLHQLVGWALDNLSGIVHDREVFKEKYS
ncbi:MAG: helix-turn-helix transcriptional regulator [Bacteroidaceae bacterium]|nr:helix-turn-helix transcriptional regulator [Bacteroidaceae bacterium]